MMTRKQFLQRLAGSAAASAVFSKLPLFATTARDIPDGKSGKKLMAGVAKKIITPSAAHLGEYKVSGTHLNGEVSQEIYARIIVLGNEAGEKLLLLSTDLLTIPRYNELATRIGARYGIDRNACMMCGTGNHQAIAFGSQKPAVLKIEKAMVETILQGVGEAIAAMRPARMALVKGTSNINAHYGLKIAAGVVNAPDFSKFADKELSVLRIDDLNGKTIALHVNYGMQSNMMQACSKQLSGDLAGSISAYVERRLGTICAWSVGAAAEAYPLSTALLSTPVHGPDGKITVEDQTLSEEMTRRLCNYFTSTQGLDILAIYNKTARFSDTFSVRAVEQKTVAAGRKGPITHRLHLAVVNDDIAFAAANSITSAGLGKLVKEALPYRTVFLSSEGDTIGYVVDSSTDAGGVAGANSAAANAWESEKIYVEGFKKLAKSSSVRA